MYKAKQYFLQLYIYYYYVMSRARSIIFISRSRKKVCVVVVLCYFLVDIAIIQVASDIISFIGDLENLQEFRGKERHCTCNTVPEAFIRYPRPIDNLLKLNSSTPCRFLSSWMVRDKKRCFALERSIPNGDYFLD